MLKTSNFPTLFSRYFFILNIVLVSLNKLETVFGASECHNVQKAPTCIELIIAHAPDYHLPVTPQKTALTHTDNIILSFECSLDYKHTLALYASKVNTVLRSHQKVSFISYLFLYNRALFSQSADDDIPKSI